MKAKKQDPKGSRERILRAALDEFAEHGLAGARVDRIGRKAGINKAMIYYHFDSKEDLYIKVLEAEVVARIGMVAREFEGSRDLEGVLEFIAESYYRFLAPGSKLAPLFLREIAEGGERLKRILPDLGLQRRLPERLIAIADKGKEEGRYRDVDIRHAIVSFVGMCLFYLLASPLVNEIWEIKDAKRFRVERPKAIVDLFMRGMEAR
jgi:TetR/AcrR family transcriptional regulator